MILYTLEQLYTSVDGKEKEKRGEKGISEKEREKWSVRGGKEEKRLIKRGGLSLYLGHKELVEKMKREEDGGGRVRRKTGRKKREKRETWP